MLTLPLSDLIAADDDDDSDDDDEDDDEDDDDDDSNLTNKCPSDLKIAYIS